MTDEAMVVLSGVRKVFRDFWLRPTVAAVDGIDLTVKRGSVFGLLGPNGSGKSTTIRMLLGLLRPTAGTIRIAGLPPQSADARRLIGYLPELSYLHPFLTAAETIRYYAGLCGLSGSETKRRTRELLEMVGLSAVANRAVGEFSKGMARRVALASALVGKPELLVLDEPTSGLDPVSTHEVKSLVAGLSRRGMTILMTSHLLADAGDICTDFAILDRGRKVSGGAVAELKVSLEKFFLAQVGTGSEFKMAEFLQ